MRLSTIGGTYAQQFGYDGAALIGEYDTSGVLARRYVFGPGSDEPLVLYSIYMGVTNRNWLHADERGSIVGYSSDDGTGGTYNGYDDYGQRNATNWGRYQYTGQFWLVSPDLYYYKARMYAPSLGRFLQTDPIGYGDGLNMYAYAHADPINGSDPSGTKSGHDLEGASNAEKCISDCPTYTGSRIPGNIVGGLFGFQAFLGGAPSNANAAELGYGNTATWERTGTVQPDGSVQWGATNYNVPLLDGGSFGFSTSSPLNGSEAQLAGYSNYGPAFGQVDSFSSSRGILSSKSGGYVQAIDDIDTLAGYNNIPPLGFKGWVDGPPTGWFMAPITNGWRIFSNSGLQLRLMNGGNVRIDIRSGMQVSPLFTDRSQFGETVHYGR